MTTWRVLLESLIWGLADVGGLNAKWLPIHRRELAQTHGMGQVLTEWLGGSSVFVIRACESGIHWFRLAEDALLVALKYVSSTSTHAHDITYFALQC